MSAQRLPSFLVIGAKKSATSSLYWWLQEQPECYLASPKETDFFTREDRWARGLGWYAAQFREARDAQLLGEASVSYTDPALSERAAERIAATLPGVQLIYVVRDPIERLRSHFRHEVQRHREPRSLLQALGDPRNPYVAASKYHECVRPYLDRFPRDRICVVRFEDLVGRDEIGWPQVLEALGLTFRPSPGTAHNVSAENRQWSSAMERLHRRRIVRFGAVARLPGPIRRIGGRLLLRDGSAYREHLEDSRRPIPDDLVAAIWDDVRMLERWLGSPRSLWERPGLSQGSAA